MSQPPYPGPSYGEQPSSGQPYGEQPSSGQPYQGQPYSGQPYPGPPNPDVPTSVPPGYPPTQPYSTGPDYGQPQYGQPADYGQPAYGGQPGYSQPDYGQQGYPPPGFPPPAPPKKSRTLPIVLLSVAVVLVLCIGGIVAVVLVANNSDKDKDTVTTSGTTAPTDEPSAKPTKNTAAVTIVEPKTLGGRPKLTDSQYAGAAAQLKSSLALIPNSTKTVGALYGVTEKHNIVALAATAAPMDDPSSALEQLFYEAGIGGLKINNITSASTGKLGGAAKCGSTSTSGVDTAICSWADNGSLGLIVWYFKSVSKAKAEFPAVRAQVEKKS